MVGSGRPVNARVIGDPNQDDNSGNDRLPGLGRNSLLSPNYASTDMRLTRRIYAGDRVKLELLAESFNLLNRVNLGDPSTSLTSASFGRSTAARAARNIQFGMRLSF